MVLQPLDWFSIIAFFVVSLAIGIGVARRAGKSSTEFFLSGRNMPWWLLGVSMVATTFSADTPNLVTDIVRQNGVAGNWVWWAFLLTGMLTVFVYAKLWRRSGVLTDLEFYELRYGGRPAAFLRGFRALYLGVFFNVLIMAAVSLAMIKIAGVMLNLSPATTLIIASVVTVVYSALGGLRGVLITDFIQFLIAMVGSIGAAVVAVNLTQIGGIDALLTDERVLPKLRLLPDFSNTDAVVTLLVLPLAVQWWSVWYPGSEPGGGGYVAQRMLSARSERHAIGATLLFNVAHYALRPWPWIIVALCSLIVYPDLASLRNAFPEIDPAVVQHDLAYPAMLTHLPSGLLGIVVASLIAAFMSTISTHLNWGSSYVVHDFYRRFINREADERALVRIGRWSTAMLMILAGLLALLLSNALQAFNILLQVGAGTGLIFILRWFWWRISPWSEITAMIVSFVIAVYFQFVHVQAGFVPITTGAQLVVGVGLTTVAWVSVTFASRPTDIQTLVRFYNLVHPGGPGWSRVVAEGRRQGYDFAKEGEGWQLPLEILCMMVATFTVYGALFSTGYAIYGNSGPALILGLVAAVGAFTLAALWRRLRTQ